MKEIFPFYQELEYLDLTNFYYNINDLFYIFAFCFNLEEIKDFDKFNTNNITNISTFSLCMEFKLDISNFKNKIITDMEAMFFD